MGSILYTNFYFISNLTIDLKSSSYFIVSVLNFDMSSNEIDTQNKNILKITYYSIHFPHFMTKVRFVGTLERDTHNLESTYRAGNKTKGYELNEHVLLI